MVAITTHDVVGLGKVHETAGDVAVGGPVGNDVDLGVAVVAVLADGGGVVVSGLNVSSVADGVIGCEWDHLQQTRDGIG